MFPIYLDKPIQHTAYSIHSIWHTHREATQFRAKSKSLLLKLHFSEMADYIDRFGHWFHIGTNFQKLRSKTESFYILISSWRDKNASWIWARLSSMPLIPFIGKSDSSTNLWWKDFLKSSRSKLTAWTLRKSQKGFQALNFDRLHKHDFEQFAAEKSDEPKFPFGTFGNWFLWVFIEFTHEILWIWNIALNPKCVSHLLLSVAFVHSPSSHCAINCIHSLFIFNVHALYDSSIISTI